jgi:hypothetical protein
VPESGPRQQELAGGASELARRLPPATVVVARAAVAAARAGSVQPRTAVAVVARAAGYRRCSAAACRFAVPVELVPGRDCPLMPPVEAGPLFSPPWKVKECFSRVSRINMASNSLAARFSGLSGSLDTPLFSYGRAGAERQTSAC